MEKTKSRLKFNKEGLKTILILIVIILAALVGTGCLEWLPFF